MFYKPAIVYGVVALVARQGRDPSPLPEWVPNRPIERGIGTAAKFASAA
jgi:hypothetical protein